MTWKRDGDGNMATMENIALARATEFIAGWRKGMGIALIIFCSGFMAMAADDSEDQTVTSHGISAFGDLKYSQTFEQFDYVNSDAPKGGLMSVWGFGTFDSLNPFIVSGSPLRYLELTFDTLMKPSDDELGTHYGLIAETITYPSPSRAWVIFDLREEARFADGSPVTAEDVVFSFDMLKTHGLPIYRAEFEPIENAQILDRHTVKFTFKPGRPTRNLPLVVAALPVFSKAHFANRPFDESSLDPIMTSGPYEVEMAEPGQFAVLRRRKNYWGGDLPVNVGQYNFDQIKIVYYADYTSAFEGFKGGDYDFREEFYSKLWSTGYDFPELTSGGISREILPDNRPSGAQGFWINLRREKFSDPRVREAIAHAFNFEWSNQTLFYSAYKRTDSFWENSDLQATGTPAPEEWVLLEPLRAWLPATIFTEEAYSPPQSNPDRLKDRRILRQAGRLLDEAGWELVDGMRQNAAGERLSVEFLISPGGFERIVNPLIENLTALGIEASMRVPDPAQIKQLTDDFDFDITVQRYVLPQTPGPELRAIFGASSANQKGSLNLAGVANPAVDSLIAAIEGATTRDEMAIAVRALDRTLRAMHIWIPNWYSSVHRVAYRNNYARPDPLPPYALGELTLWWFDDAKAALSESFGS